MSRTMIDIEDDLLAYAAELFGTNTKRATVETALRMATAPAARRRLAELIAESGAGPEELDRERESGWR